MKLKKCSKCKVEKEEKEFYLDRINNKRQTRCVACMKLWQASQPKKKYSERNRLKKWFEVDESKLCPECVETLKLYKLTLDLSDAISFFSGDKIMRHHKCKPKVKP